jgi:hypothetical protein
VSNDDAAAPRALSLVQNFWFYPKDERAILCALFPFTYNTTHSLDYRQRIQGELFVLLSFFSALFLS